MRRGARKSFCSKWESCSRATEVAGVNNVLNAAALTYVAAFVATLGNLLYLLSVRDRR